MENKCLTICNLKSRTFVLFTMAQVIAALVVTEVMPSFSDVNIGSISGFLVVLSFYLVVFIIPIILYLQLADRVSVLQYLKLNREIKSGILKGLIIGIFIFVVIFIKNGFEASRHINFNEDLVIILGKLLVGPLEEIPFRGFYLQKFQEYMKFWKANLISSLLFAVVHIPNFMGGNLISFYPVALILIVGLWMGYILKETKSLLSVSIAHSMYDLAIWIIL